MSSLDASVYLLVIAYPLLFVVMAVFMGLTYLLRRVFPGDWRSGISFRPRFAGRMKKFYTVSM